MKKVLFLAVAAIFLMAVFGFAEERATQKDAEALVKHAVEFYKANGRDKALAEYNNPHGKFADIPRGLFIFAYTFDGKCVAQGANTAMVGKVFIDMKNPDGKPVVKDLLEIAKTKGKGWYDYRWPNPANKKLETKTSYVERVDDLMIGSGFYKAD